MLKNLTTIKSIADQLPPIIFVNHDVNYGIGLETLLPNYHIISSGEHPFNERLEDAGVNLFYTRDYQTSSYDLLSHKETKIYLSQIEDPHLLFFKPNSKYFRYCKKQHWNVLNNKPSMSLLLENKLKFPKTLDQLKIPYPETLFVKLQKGIQNEIKKKLGESYVIQFARSFGGNKTFWIKNDSDIQPLIEEYSGRTVKATKLINGWNLTINACVTQFGIAVSYPFHQLTGIDILTQSELGSCGNDWGEVPLSPDAVREIIAITKKIGNFLRSKNYKGIYGVDFVVEYETNAIYTIELNPRLVASVPIFTQSQMENEEIPMLLLHCLEFLDIDYQIDINAVNEKLQRPRNLSQIILHNLEDEPNVISKLDKSLSSLEGAGYRLEHINENESLFIPQQAGRTASENGEISRIFIKDNVFDTIDKTLREKYKTLAEKIYEEQMGECV